MAEMRNDPIPNPLSENSFEGFRLEAPIPDPDPDPERWRKSTPIPDPDPDPERWRESTPISNLLVTEDVGDVGDVGVADCGEVLHGFKRCCICGGVYPLSEFYKNKKHSHGRQAQCKNCMKDIVFERKYGITRREKQAMFERQDGRCYVCHTPISEASAAHMDHCHDSGKVGKLLCAGCNTAIGKLGESFEHIARVVWYLIVVRPTWQIICKAFSKRKK